jgi:hypothetical protein
MPPPTGFESQEQLDETVGLIDSFKSVTPSSLPRTFCIRRAVALIAEESERQRRSYKRPIAHLTQPVGYNDTLE